MWQLTRNNVSMGPLESKEWNGGGPGLKIEIRLWQTKSS